MPFGFIPISESFKINFYNNFIVENRYMLFVRGLGITLSVAAMSMIVGFIIGIIVASMKMSKIKFLNVCANIYLDIIRGTPATLQLLIFYFVVFGKVDINKIIVAVLAFGINSGAYVSEIIRAGILSVDSGQKEAGRSLGLSGSDTMLLIVFPQAIKNILPALGNEFIMLLKETAILSLISLMDLTMASSFVASRTYAPFMPLIGSAIIYFIIVKCVSILLSKYEIKLRRSDLR